MASAKGLVKVLDAGLEVEAGIRRPIRLTPDGYAGAAYAGSVYPLHVGDVIDLAGPSWEIADCNRFLLSGAEVPYAPTSPVPADGLTGFDLDWYLETNTFGHYVVFNASERVAGNVVAALEAAQLSVQRWDVSHRAADNGNFYDWFARLRFKGTREQALALVRVALAPQPLPEVSAALAPTTDPALVRLADAEARVEALLDQLHALSRRAEAAEREAARLRDALEASETSEHAFREGLRLADKRSLDLQQQLTALRDSVGGGPDIAQLVKGLADAEELRELALAENAILLERAKNAEWEFEQQRERAEDLADRVDGLVDRVAELDALESERRRVATGVRPRRGGVVEFLPTAFGRLEFILDSVEVIANLDSPAAVMRALAAIDAGQLVGKDLESIPGWFEVGRLATGNSGSQGLGRIYYKPGGERVIVSVHIKQDDKEQRRHIERLRAH